MAKTGGLRHTKRERAKKAGGLKEPGESESVSSIQERRGSAAVARSTKRGD